MSLPLSGVLVDPLGDVGRLLAQRHHHGARLGVEPHLTGGVTHLLDHPAHHARVVHRGGRGDLARTTTRPVVNSVSHATRALGSCAKIASEDAVGDLVGHLVGVAHRDRFTGKQVAIVFAARNSFS